MAGNVIYEAHPAMFRANPFYFILCVLLIAAFGLGIILLLYWYIKCQATSLTITDNELLYEKGILSKERLAVSLRHVRLVQVNQSFLNRIFGVGEVIIATAGDEPEFSVGELPEPHEVREAISRAQALHAAD